MSRRRVLTLGALAALGASIAVPQRMSREDRPPPSPPRIHGGPLLDSRPVVDVRNLGATGDGRTDDGEAIRHGLDMVNDSGGTLFFPAGTYRYLATAPLGPAAGITIAGVPGSSTIALDHSSDYLDLFRIDADGVTIDGIALRRDAGFPTVLLNLGPVRGFTLSRSTLEGQQRAYGGAICHGIKFADAGTSSAISIVDSSISGVVYGLLQDNASTGVVDGVTVQRCRFTGNANTDLEFNSPHGQIRQITVTGCTFADNDSPGFAVGLAHVIGAEVTQNTFDRYALEAVHVEDYSESVLIQGNRFSSCGLRDYSHVQIISGCRDVRVVGNSFDASMNENPIYVVNALPGGDWPTAGDRPPGPPFDVVVRGNDFACSGAATPVYFEGVRGGSITGNSIAGGDVGSPDDAFRLLDDGGSTVTGNTINGRQY